MEIPIGLITGILSAISAFVGLYSWVLRKRDEEAEKLRKEIFESLFEAKENFRKELITLKDMIFNQREDIDKQKTVILSSTTKHEVLINMIQDSILKLDRQIERQNIKLDGFGKVIVKE